MKNFDRINFFVYGEVPDLPDGLVFGCVCARLGIESDVNKRLLWDCLWPGFLNPYDGPWMDKNWVYKPAEPLPLCGYKYYEMKGVI